MTFRFQARTTAQHSDVRAAIARAKSGRDALLWERGSCSGRRSRNGWIGPVERTERSSYAWLGLQRREIDKQFGAGGVLPRPWCGIDPDLLVERQEARQREPIAAEVSF